MENSTLATIGNDPGARDKYFDNFRRSEHLEPEKILLLALLEDAVHCYHKYATAHDRSGRERYHEVEEWFMGGGNGWVFSFENACGYLGLDAQYVRRGLRESKASQATAQRPASRPHARHRRAA